MRSHLHTPSVDYTAREREADYTAKEHGVSTQERVTTFGAEKIRGSEMADFSFIGQLQLHQHGTLDSVDR